MLKKYFIPHKKNNYKPHFFRKGSTFGLLGLVTFIFIIALCGQFILKNTDMVALVLPRVLVDYTNQDRQAERYGTLAINKTLEKAAQMKADDMATKGYFSHNTPDGKTPWYFFKQAGYNFRYAGENLAVNFSDSSEVNTAWMNSPLHRKNIMNGNFTEIGIATAEGMYQGRQTTFVVQLFGTPAPAPAKASTSTRNTIKKPSISTIVPSTILGVAEQSELFVAVVDTTNSEVEARSDDRQYSSWLEKVLVSPKKTLSFSYLVIALVVVGALLLTIFIEIKKQHLIIIASALTILIVVSVLLYMYKTVLFAPLSIA